jgi:hypothetical protein
MANRFINSECCMALSLASQVWLPALPENEHWHPFAITYDRHKLSWADGETSYCGDGDLVY